MSCLIYFDSYRSLIRGCWWSLCKKVEHFTVYRKLLSSYASSLRAERCKNIIAAKEVICLVSTFIWKDITVCWRPFFHCDSGEWETAFSLSLAESVLKYHKSYRAPRYNIISIYPSHGIDSQICCENATLLLWFNICLFQGGDSFLFCAYRCHLNDIENIIPFVGLGLVYTLSNPELSTALLHFRIFAGSRVLHTISYLTPLPQPSRVLTFFTGLLVNISMAYAILSRISLF